MNNIRKIRTASMSLKCFTSSLVILISLNCFSQDKDEATVTNVTKVTFINPGLSYELKIAKLQSLYAQAFMNTSGSFSASGSQGIKSKFYFDPAFDVQYRYYYNSKKRAEKGKRTEMNSMNYLTAAFEMVLSKRHPHYVNYVENNIRPINTIGLAWGFQRNYKNRFSLDFYAGLGYLFTKETIPNPSSFGQTVIEHVGQISLLSQINIGMWLNRRK